MKNINLILILFFAFIATTCSKESDLQCTEANTNKILPHAWDFFFFKTGSWWVYEEESTGQLDSTWVGTQTLFTDNAKSAKNSCGCGKGKCVQVAKMSFFSSRHNNESIYGFHMGSSLIDGGCEIMEGDGVYKNYSGYRVRYKDNTYFKNSPTKGIYEDMDSIVVKGKTYKDIFHHYHEQTENIGDWQHEAWYARNIYLVRYRLFDGTTWNLIKYHVIK